MRRKVMVAALLAGSAFTIGAPARAQDRQAEAAAPAKSESVEAKVKERRSSPLEPVWSALTLHKDEDASFLNELRLVGRFHLDHYSVDAGSEEESDLVVRRARFGAKARLLGKLEAHAEAEFDLEGGPLYNRLTDAYLAWRFSDAARLTVGKHSVKFTLDGATSSNELLTIDRSNVANNFWFTEEYIPGVSVSGRSGSWAYNTGIYSGGRRNSEFGDFKGGYFWLGSVGRDFADALGVERALVRADYVYNEPDKGSDFTRPFANIGSLVFVLDGGRWGFSGDIVAADGFLVQSDALGVTALPWLDLTDRLQLAGRYTLVKSEDLNGVRLARYENTVASGRGDLYQELYAGLNYYIYGHRLKAQTGVTYANMRDRARDGGAYDGWAWTTGLRVSW